MSNRDNLNAASTALTHAERAYADAERTYRRRVDSDHEAIRAEQERAYAPDLRAAENEALRVAEEAHATARAILQQTNTPRLKVDIETEVRAGASYPRLKDRVATMPLDKLAQSVRTAIDTGDKAEMFNVFELLPSRLDGVDPAGLSQTDRDARAQLRAMRSEIGDLLRDPSQDELREDALSVADAAYELKKRAGAYQKANKPKKTYAFMFPGDVRIER